MNGNADSYYARQLNEAQYAPAGGPQTQNHMMSMSDFRAMAGMGNTLDDIVTENRKELERRHHTMNHAQQPYHRDMTPHDNDPRRSSMMEFGSGPAGNLNGYQFNPGSVPENGEMGLEGSATPVQSPMVNELRRQSTGEMALSAQYGDINPAFNNAMRYSGSFQSPMSATDPLQFDPTAGYSPAGLPVSMSLDFPPRSLDAPSSGEATPINQFGHAAVTQGLSEANFSPLENAFSNGMQGADDPGGGNTTMTGMEGADQDLMEGMPGMSSTDRGQPPANNRQSVALSTPASSGKIRPSVPNVQTSLPPEGAMPKSAKGPEAGAMIKSDPSQTGPFPHKQQDKRSMFSGVYSSSGFDMVKVLSRVENRANPEIDLGSVDMSCAFVVCDVTQHDLPIVYCSDIFERLTGYTKHEILGRNCRFLQAPDGKVTSGVKRKYVDDDVVLQLKNKITSRKEAQTSIINYRKGGQPFMNLLTLIPITYDPDDVVYKYYVGFQVDLVETPQSVTKKNSDGSYSINYSRGYLPRYVWQTPEANRHQTDMGQTIPRDEVSAVLTTIGNGESELTKRLMDKVLLENTDDVVHVLSLKGLFLYLSPSSRKVLEYDSAELVGTALSSVCHPSDIVPVTRELKDTSTGASVNVVFRIRRKHSGYTWFESHGSLHTEQGKGRKCIILVGRERPVYALSRNDIVAAGGIGESELWTKMSTSGMFLYVSSNVRTLLDRQPEELVGSSIQALMRSESKIEFDRTLEKARTGRRVNIKHEMQNKRGQVLQANTTIYPGDAVEGQKPTFLVAQTRFSKLTRSASSLTAPKSTPPSPRTDQASTGSTIAGANASAPTATSATVNANTTTPTTTAAAAANASSASPTLATNPSRSPTQPAPSGPSNVTTVGLKAGPTGQPIDSVSTEPGGRGLPIGTQDVALASADNVFDELKTTRSTSWQFELRQMEKRNRLLVEELQALLSSKKKRKRRKGAGQLQKDCANCHTRVTPEWRRGPSGNRDLCNSCGLRWAKQNGRVSPRTGSQHSAKQSASPPHPSPLGNEVSSSAVHPAVTATSNGTASNNTHPPPPPLQVNTTGSMGPPPDRRSLSSGAGSGGGVHVKSVSPMDVSGGGGSAGSAGSVESGSSSGTARYESITHAGVGKRVPKIEGE
ncbi:MAG: hypothetical protein M4579_002071 [Chaenotheca gracillima]|nr:MAG: hypothetical protein M4579_002071 [Chaenotheca gracillima]